MQQVLIVLRFYATGTFQRVIGDLFGVSVFAACRVIQKVSRAIAKQKRQFLSIPWNLADVQRKFYEVGHFPGVIRAMLSKGLRLVQRIEQYNLNQALLVLEETIALTA